MEHKIQWAEEQVKFLERVASGFGFDAIQAKIKLDHIKSLSREDFNQAAISAYDEHH